MQALTSTAPTMSSREIAELVEKRHDNVKRTIETLTDRGVIVRPQIEDEPLFDAIGRPRSESVYRVGKRDSYVIVAQLSPEFTARLVDRWQELEAAVAPLAPTLALPQSFADALQLAADQARQIERQSAEIAALAPKGEAYDRFLNADGLIGLQNVGRALQCHPNLFIKGLIPDYCFRDARGTVVARQISVDRGLFVNKPYDAPNGKVYLRAFMTTKGLDYFSTRIPAGTENRKHQTVPALPAAATAH